MDAAHNEPLGTGDAEADGRVQLQLAIFDITRDARGRDLDGIKDRLRGEFARRGVAVPPATWLDSVASAAFYGQPYVVDLPSAVAADDAVGAPTDNVREQLEVRRELRREKLPAGILPSASEWELSPEEVTTAGQDPARAGSGHGTDRRALAARAVLLAAGIAAVLVFAGSRASRRRTGRASHRT